MGQLGMQELIVIFVIALLVFGPKKLPELGKSLGKGLREFKRATNEMKATLDDQFKEASSEIRETGRDLRNVERDLKKDLEADQASAMPPASPVPTSGTVGQGSIKAPADESGDAEPEPVTAEATESPKAPAGGGGDAEPEPVTTEATESPKAPADEANKPSGTPS